MTWVCTPMSLRSSSGVRRGAAFKDAERASTGIRLLDLPVEAGVLDIVARIAERRTQDRLPVFYLGETLQFLQMHEQLVVELLLNVGLEDIATE